mgnify:CR=1 FL=1
MRALAKAGGLMQITVYDGFLKKGCGADITDVIRHINHAVAIMGIDHVGIGTDFDGDGGIPGLSSAADMLNLTRHLLIEGYSRGDVEKILGGNFMKLL